MMLLIQLPKTVSRLEKEPIFKFSFICDPRSYCIQLIDNHERDFGSFARRMLVVFYWNTIFVLGKSTFNFFLVSSSIGFPVKFK